MRHAIWLLFDFGVDGDYEGIYYWLDTQKAIECGTSFAFFRFEHQGDVLTDLEEGLRQGVKLRPKDRIYVVYPAADGRFKGRFLFGTRKRAAWEGSAGGVASSVDES